VLIDEALHGGESADASGPAGTGSTVETVRAPVKSYSDAAVASSQLPVTAFLPKHPLITCLVWLAGVVLIAVVELLYHFVYSGAPAELRGSLTALDVTARGSLAGWFGSVSLAVAAFGSLLIYQIRRHRTDDYRGRYRWWLWLLPLLLVLSVNAATGLHEVLSGILTSVTGAEIALQGKGWWMLAYAAVFLPIVPQLLIELWPSRMATFLLVATLAGYISAALFELGILHLPQPAATTICQSTVLLVAHLGTLVTILAYGRYVYLDAHDRLAPRRQWLKWPRWKSGKKKSRTKTSASEKSASGQQVRIDEPHAKIGQATPSTGSFRLPVGNDGDEEEDEAPEADGRKPSKSERRRLRKEAQRMQRG
jgi:hypothetical protein